MIADAKAFRAGKRRQKVKGRKISGPFIPMPREVLDSPEFGELSAHATKLVVELARQFRGQNNGDFSAAWSRVEPRGWQSKGTLARAKKELVASSFVIVTRQGGRHRCSLYALTWWAIDECNGKHDEPPTHAPLHLWRKSKSQAPGRTNAVRIDTNQTHERTCDAFGGPDANQSSASI